MLSNQFRFAEIVELTNSVDPSDGFMANWREIFSREELRQPLDSCNEVLMVVVEPGQDSCRTDDLDKV